MSRTPNGSGDPEGNQLQAVTIAQFMHAAADPQSVHVLGGDLNAIQGSPTILYLLERQPLTIRGTTYQNPLELDDTWQMDPGNAGQRRPGTVGRGGQSILDWLMTDPAANVVHAAVIEFNIPPGQELNFSDHFPVVATIEFSGVCPSTTLYGCGTNPTGSLSVLSGVPSIGTTMTIGVDNPLGTQNAGATPFLIIALAPDPNFPCGTQLPGFGMAGPAAPGELLISLAPPTLAVSGPAWTGPGNPAPIALSFPSDRNLISVALFVQGVLLDAGGSSGNPFGLADAVRLVIGP